MFEKIQLDCFSAELNSAKCPSITNICNNQSFGKINDFDLKNNFLKKIPTCFQNMRIKETKN